MRIRSLPSAPRRVVRCQIRPSRRLRFFRNQLSKLDRSPLNLLTLLDSATAPSFLPRRLCRPTYRAHRAQGRWHHHSRRRPRDIRPSECWDCPVDIRPTDIFAQRQDFWVARPTLEPFDPAQNSWRSIIGRSGPQSAVRTSPGLAGIPRRPAALGGQGCRRPGRARACCGGDRS